MENKHYIVYDSFYSILYDLGVGHPLVKQTPPLFDDRISEILESSGEK